MKITIKLGLITGLFICSLSISSCPRKQPNTDLGFSCQRLSSCYLNFGAQLMDMQVKKLVEDAQKTKDENKCLDAITQFSAAVKQECPF